MASEKPILVQSKQAQNVMAATFEFSFDDHMIAEDGTEVGFGGGLGATSKKIKIMNLPANAIPLAGRLYVLEAFNGTAPTAFQLGNSKTAGKYGDLKANLAQVGRTDLTATSFADLANDDIYLTLSVGTNVTTGRALIEIEYIVPGRANEVTR